MQITRRQSAVLASCALVGAGLASNTSSLADASDEAAVGQAAEALRAAMLAADRTRLEALVADELSYGHSGGVVQTKAEFVDVLATRKTAYKSITLAGGTTVIAGDAAIVRAVADFVFETDGKPGTSHIGVLQVWQKRGNDWKLLARQGFKL